MKIKDYEAAALRIALLYNSRNNGLLAFIKNTNPYEAKTKGKPLKFGITYFAERETTAEEALKNVKILKPYAEYAMKLNELEMTIDTDYRETPDCSFFDLVDKYTESVRNWELPAFEGGAQ